MSTLSRVKTWTQEVLTAADLNAEFNNIINDYNGSIDENNLGTIQNIVFSNATSTDTIDITASSTGAALVVNNDFKLDANGQVEFGGSLSPGYISNLGFTLSSGTFTITDAGGTALSSTNPAWITVPSVTAGQMVCLKITSGGTFNDDAHASSHLTNLGHGITETAHWSSDMPWFIYVCNEDDTGTNAGFFISRRPNLSVTPAATYIHDKDAAASNDTDSSIFGMWSDDSGKASKPCRCIGAFRMQWSTTTDDWTVQTPGNTDGIGEHAINATCGTVWTFPEGQNGNESGQYHSVTDSSTTLTFASTDSVYKISRTGEVQFTVDTGAVSANGGDGTTLFSFVPILPNSAYSVFVKGPHGSGEFIINDAIYGITAFFSDIPTGRIIFRYDDQTGSWGTVDDDLFVGITDSISYSVTYSI